MFGTKLEAVERRQRRKKPRAFPTGIPALSVAAALAVTDGPETVGFVIEHDGSWFAYGRDRELIGEYGTRAAAVKSLPRAANGASEIKENKST